MTINVSGSNDIHNWISAAKVAGFINPADYENHWSVTGYNFVTTAIELDDNTAGAFTDQIRLYNPAGAYKQIGVMASNVASTDSYWDDYDVTGLYLFGNLSNSVGELVYGTAHYYEDGGLAVRDNGPLDIELTEVSTGGTPGNIYYAIGIAKSDPANNTVSLPTNLWSSFAILEAAKALRNGNGSALEALLDLDSWNVNGTSVANTIFGHAKNDTLRGNGGEDYLAGGGGDDNMDGGTDYDYMVGGKGNDTMFGDSGNDVVSGEEGNDLVMGGRGNDFVYGGDGKDDLWGHEDSNTITGGNGDDTFHSFENGTNTVNGNAGNDRYILGAGADIITDDSGYDTIQFTAIASADWISGSWLSDLANDNWDPTLFERYELTADADTLVMNNSFLTPFSIVGGAGSDFIIGGGGADLIWGDNGNDRLQGQNGRDSLNGGSGLDHLIGDAGNDRLRGGGSNDTLNGGAGLDTAEFDDHFGAWSRGWTIDLIAGTARTQFNGRPGSGLLYSTETDTLFGIESVIASKGNDKIQSAEGRIVESNVIALGGSPSIDGSEGVDTLTLSPTITSATSVLGRTADDVVTFSGDNAGSVATATTVLSGSGLFQTFKSAEGRLNFRNIEKLDTSVGDDVVTGSTAADYLLLGAGKDKVTGGAGADRLDGGADADSFIYNATNEGADTIVNFDDADVFNFKGAAFGNLAVGALKSATFWSNTSGLAHDASDRFIYNATDDTLWYDSNGNVANGTIIKIADLTNDFTLRASDILIV